MSSQGNSLTREAWRRLCADRLAMAGLVLLSVIVIACVAGPWFTGFDPTALRPYVGATPPMTERVDALQQNQLRVGEAPLLAERALQAEQIEITYTEEVFQTLRLVLRRGKISSLRDDDGAVAVDRLVLSEGQAVEVDAAGAELRPLPAATLVVGEASPEGFLADRQRVAFIRLGESKDQTLAATLENGLVSSLSIDGAAMDNAAIRGGSITGIQADGQTLSRFHWLGTDASGRDLLTRVLWGGRISLLVGLVATLVSVLIGTVYGAASGYLGGRTDRLMMASVDILYAIPFLFLVILLLVLFGRDILLLFVALGAVQWLTMARIVRGQSLSLRNREFVEAARVAGAGDARIIATHVIPNCLGPIVVYATLTVPLVILQESFLAFIGLQVQWGGTNLDSWGALVKQGMNSLDTVGGDRWWLLLWPSLAMAATLLALNVLGDGLRDALDPKLRGAK